MSQTDSDGRSVFASTLSDCLSGGAEIKLRINGNRDLLDFDMWSAPWKRFDLELVKANISLGESDNSDFEIVKGWVQRYTAEILSILPLEDTDAVQRSFRDIPKARYLRSL